MRSKSCMSALHSKFYMLGWEVLLCTSTSDIRIQYFPCNIDMLNDLEVKCSKLKTYRLRSEYCHSIHNTDLKTAGAISSIVRFSA